MDKLFSICFVEVFFFTISVIIKNWVKMDDMTWSGVGIVRQAMLRAIKDRKLKKKNTLIISNTLHETIFVLFLTITGHQTKYPHL